MTTTTTCSPGAMTSHVQCDVCFSLIFGRIGYSENDLNICMQECLIAVQDSYTTNLILRKTIEGYLDSVLLLTFKT